MLFFYIASLLLCIATQSICVCFLPSFPLPQISLSSPTPSPLSRPLFQLWVLTTTFYPFYPFGCVGDLFLRPTALALLVCRYHKLLLYHCCCLHCCSRPRRISASAWKSSTPPSTRASSAASCDALWSCSGTGSLPRYTYNGSCF